MLHVAIKKQLSHFELNVEFTLNNEIAVLFGPSGSGKTTVLNSIAGLIKPDQGIIQLNGQSIYEAPKVFAPIQKRHIGYLFQDRSEEHTSELQSRGHLVCRLLLEKKKLYIR